MKTSGPSTDAAAGPQMGPSCGRGHPKRRKVKSSAGSPVLGGDLAFLRPLKFEVWHGRGADRRKVETYSRAEADLAFERLETEAQDAAIFLGSMLVRGEG